MEIGAVVQYFMDIVDDRFYVRSHSGETAFDLIVWAADDAKWVTSNLLILPYLCWDVEYAP